MINNNNIQLIENVITVAEQNSILEYVFSNEFPWYYQSKMVATESVFANAINSYFFSHMLIVRQEEDEFGRYLYGNEPKEGKINSNDWDKFKPIFTKAIPDYKTIYRAAINLTFGIENTNELKCSLPHRDHAFDHKNFICYLNKFSNGHTYIMNDDMQVTDSITPKERCAITFDGNLMHAQGFCNLNEKRLVMVVTYNN